MVTKVSCETLARLQALCDLVMEWNSKLNLIGYSTVNNVWQRHVEDSLQGLPHLLGDRVVDIGSGAGFPGLVLAIASNKTFTLVESDERKAEFLRGAARRLNLNTEILNERIETLVPLNSDTITTRAFSRLVKTLPTLAQHLTKNGRAICYKGRHHNQEIAEARQKWTFSVEKHESVTDKEAALLLISGINRKNA